MRQAATSCTFDGFRYDGDRGESSAGFVLLKARATNDGGYLLGEETSDWGAWGEMTTLLFVCLFVSYLFRVGHSTDMYSLLQENLLGGKKESVSIEVIMYTYVERR